MIEYQYLGYTKIESLQLGLDKHAAEGWHVHSMMAITGGTAILFARETDIKQCGICSKEGHTSDEHGDQPLAGVWMVYDNDQGPYVISLFETSEEAARAVGAMGWGKIGFWIFGMELREAVQAWETRP